MSGFIKPGEFLMSENELCKYYGMSRTSVRKSLEQLLKEGLIVKKVGQGTIVSPDVVLEPSKNKVLRIFATTPSHFFDLCMPQIIERFRRDHPNVEVKCLLVSTSEFWKSVKRSRDLGLQPDLLYVSDFSFGMAEELPRFTDLDVLLSDPASSIYPRLRSAFSRDGKLKAVPVTFSTVYLAYNPELFRRYGVAEPTEHWTKEDFLKAAAQLTMDTNGDGIADVYGVTISTALSRWPVFALQNGVRFKTADNLSAMTRTFEFLHELLYVRRVAALSNRGTLNADAFMREKSAMVLTTSIELAGWNYQGMRFAPQVAPLPFGDRKDTLLIANAFIVPDGSEEPELAKRFIRAAIHPEAQEAFSRTAGFISVLPDINAKVLDTPLLESLHIHRDVSENSFFPHELFADVSQIEELDAELSLFWSGMHSASEMAEQMRRILTPPSLMTAEH